MFVLLSISAYIFRSKTTLVKWLLHRYNDGATVKQLIPCNQVGSSSKQMGTGIQTNRVFEPLLSAEQVTTLQVSSDTEP